MTEQTIEMDCPPMTPRPDSFIEGVIKGTGLPLREPISKAFGNWKWDYSDINEEVFRKAKPILAERITSLYETGMIRYGSW